MEKFIALLVKLIDLFLKGKKSPEEIRDEAEAQTTGNTIDDSLDTINTELRDNS